MKRRSVLQWGLGMGLQAGWSAQAEVRPKLRPAEAPNLGALHWVSRTLGALGTTVQLRAAHASATQAASALDAAVADIRQLEDTLSLFRPESDVQRLNRHGVLVRPHPDVLEILRIAQTVSQRSQGAFDVTVQPLWQVFEAASARGAIPRASEVVAARACVGWQRMHLGADAITLAPGMGVTLNGIAQGYIADRVRARLQQFGIAHALVDTGEFAPLGNAQGGRDWTLGLADPRHHDALLGRLAMQGLCMATSADDQCSFSADHQHHHIFDPHTGYSPPDIASVTVLAPHCVLADALTKVLFMAGFERALAVAQSWGVQAVVVSKRGQVRATPGLPLLQT